MFKIYKRLRAGDLRYILSTKTLQEAIDLAQLYSDHAMLGHYDYIIFPAESLTYIKPKAQSCVAYIQ